MKSLFQNIKVKGTMLFLCLITLTGCPKQKYPIEMARESAKNEAINTSLHLIYLIKNKDYDSIAKMHDGGLIKNYRFYKSEKVFRSEVNFLSIEIPKGGNINKEKLEVIDENHQPNSTSDLQCIYHVYKTDSAELSVIIYFMDDIGPKEILNFRKQYENFKFNYELDTNYIRIGDSLMRVKDSLNNVHK